MFVYDLTTHAVSRWLSVEWYVNKHMCRLTTVIRSEKCVVRQFRRRAKVIECPYTYQDSIAYYTPSLYVAYCS
jgi:hypothetical protein